MSNPQVTIIIVNWNGKHHLQACLESLENQTFQNFTTVLVDNNSNDGSVVFVKENFPSVSVTQLDDNYGFCKPNNIAMADVQTKYVCLLNNDTELEKDCLSRMFEVIESDPKIGICDAKQVMFDQREVVFSVGADYTLAGSSIGAGIFKKDIDLDETRECSIGMAACIYYRKEMLDKIGLFDEDFFAGREDVDLSVRALLAGYVIRNVGSATCFHKVSATRGDSSPTYVRRGQRNLHWVFFKNLPTSLLRRYVFQHLIYTLMTAVFYFKRGRGGSWILSKWDVLRDLKTLRSKRREVQKLKNVSDAEFERLLTKDWFDMSKALGKFRSPRLSDREVP